MTVRISTLVENTATFGFLGEWGLSFFIDLDGYRLLMDTGMTDTVIINARKMKIDFAELDAIVLSHGHIDHTGGLRNVLNHTGPIDICAHPSALKPKFSTRKSGAPINIGIPFTRSELEARGAVFQLTREPVQLHKNVVTTGEIPQITDYEHFSTTFYFREDSEDEIDTFEDDLSLGIRTDKGLVVVLGCAHRGVINSIKRLEKLTGESRLVAVVGGTHLYDASPERIDATIREIKSRGTPKIACTHCTGLAATCRLQTAFGEDFIPCHAGTELVF